MTNEERNAVATRLEQALPILQRYYPDGWKDFRSPLPADWSAGLFMKIRPEDCKYIQYETADPRDLMRFKAMYGGVVKAIEAAAIVSEFTHKPVSVVPPHIEIIEGDGEASKIKISYWRILFDVKESEVCW